MKKIIITAFIAGAGCFYNYRAIKCWHHPSCNVKIWSIFTSIPTGKLSNSSFFLLFKFWKERWACTVTLSHGLQYSPVLLHPFFCCCQIGIKYVHLILRFANLPICSSQRQIGCFCWKILLLARLSRNIPELPQTRIVLRMVETFFMLMVDQNFNLSEVCLIMIFELIFSAAHISFPPWWYYGGKMETQVSICIVQYW